MKRVLVTMPDDPTRESFLDARVREYLSGHFDVIYNPTPRQYTPGQLKALLPDFDAVVTGWGTPLLDAEVLGEHPRLSVIAHTGGTVGNLVDSYAYEKGIRVLSGNLLYAESVAEGTLAYMLMAQRRLPDYVNTVREGGWGLPGGDVWESVMDKTVGIVGLGTISRFLIPMLHSLRCDIRLYSHYDPEPEFLRANGVTRMELNDLFAACDIISVHSALNAENRHLIGKEQFDRIRDGALFLNTSRGAVLDEEALIAALATGRFRAVLDVFTREPLPADSPLRRMPNVYSISHKAGPTLDRRACIARHVAENMYRALQGETDLPLEISADVAKRMTRM